MASLLKRLRTTGGFGVHSPMAFSVITETLREDSRYAYYGYERIDSAGATKAERRLARLIHRVAVRFGGVRLDGEFTELEHSCAGTPDPDSPVMVRGKDAIARARRDMTAGMSFSNGRMALILPFEKLPLTHYDLFF